MKQLTPLLLSLLACTPVAAQAVEETNAPAPLIRAAEDATLDEFLWVARPIIVFADSASDPRFVTQLQYIEAELEALAERDVVVLTDTDPKTLGPLREKLRPRGFMLVLVGKDGGVKLRKPLPWTVRELSRTIDKMPMRQQEVRDRRGE